MSMITRKEKKTVYTKLFTYSVHSVKNMDDIQQWSLKNSQGLGMTEENKSAGTSFLGLKSENKDPG